jgi:hypothetical protein
MEKLTLATGERTADLELILNFSAAEIGNRPHVDLPDKEPGKACGVIHYFKAHDRDFDSTPATIIFETYVTEAQMADLMAFARVGRFPTKMAITVPTDAGVTYSWEPDGSHKIWDNSADHPRLLIESVSFDMALTPEVDDEEEFSKPNPVQVVTATDLLPDLNKAISLLRYVLVALIVIAGVLLWRR